MQNAELNKSVLFVGLYIVFTGGLYPPLWGRYADAGLTANSAPKNLIPVQMHPYKADNMRLFWR